MNKRLYLLLLALTLGLEPAGAMHIMEGFIPMKWCIIWYLIALPFVVLSYRFVARIVKASPRMKSTFALSAAYTFILSALKVPSVAGSSSHPWWDQHPRGEYLLSIYSRSLRSLCTLPPPHRAETPQKRGDLRRYLLWLYGYLYSDLLPARLCLS